MKIDELFCLDLKTDKPYITKSEYIQLCCELIEPKKIFIESNIIEVN